MSNSGFTSIQSTIIRKKRGVKETILKTLIQPSNYQPDPIKSYFDETLKITIKVYSIGFALGVRNPIKHL